MSSSPRNQFSKECMFLALMGLMRKKDFQSITVKELATKAGVSRTTFYRHYSVPLDILNDYLDSRPFGIELSYIHSMTDEKENIRQFYQYFYDNQELVYVLLKSKMKEYLREVIKRHILFTFSAQLDMHGYENEFQRAALIGLCAEILICWSEQGMNKSIEEMTGIIYSIVSKIGIPKI